MLAFDGPLLGHHVSLMSIPSRPVLATKPASPFTTRRPSTLYIPHVPKRLLGLR
jgi:hypothetical protein